MARSHGRVDLDRAAEIVFGGFEVAFFVVLRRRRWNNWRVCCWRSLAQT